MSNYPDDIHQYDNDPRSPFYDDGGYEVALDEKIKEFLENPDDIEVDLEKVGEAAIDFFCSKEHTAVDFEIWLDSYIRECAQTQAEKDIICEDEDLRL